MPASATDVLRHLVDTYGDDAGPCIRGPSREIWEIAGWTLRALCVKQKGNFRGKFAALFSYLWVKSLNCLRRPPRFLKIP